MIDPRAAELRSLRAVATGQLLVVGALGIRTRRSSGTYVIQLAGRLDTTTYEALAEMVERTLDADTHLTVLDLRDLEFIDLAGVHTILMAVLRTADQLEDFLIIPGPETVQRVIDRVQGPFRYADRRSSRPRRSAAALTTGSQTARSRWHQPKRPARLAPRR